MVRRSPFFRMAIVVLAVAMPLFAFANSIGKPAGGGDSIRWDLSVTGHDSIVLSVSHDGEVWSKTFKSGKPVVFSLRDLPSDVSVEGSYQYELRVVPTLPAGLQKKLAAARAAGDDKAASKALRDAGVVVPEAQSGAFFVSGGSIVNPDATEDGSNARFSPSTDGIGSPRTVTGPASRFKISTEDQVIPDDLIVQGSLCVGFDCVDGEAFGTDTIKMKENNTRVKFEDTSTSAGFASNDWQLTANDQPSGGANKFSIDDITGVKTPLTITAGAATNSIFVDSIGRIGARTGTPGLDFHVSTGNTPALRLEQTNAGGFTAQTWDIGGNEANFFIRDLTGGSRLSFRIRPGAPTSSIDIAASGNVGIGTASPSERLHVAAGGNVLLSQGNLTMTDGDLTLSSGLVSVNGGSVSIGTGGNLNLASNQFVLWNSSWGIRQNTSTQLEFVFGTPRMTMTTGGFIGIGTTSPASMLHVNGGDIRVSSGSFIDDGVTLTAPDYVFDPSYKLMSIDELSAFIKNEKHLPNVPSAAEFKSKGINLSKLGFNLLEKVEELTLYTVAQHEQIGTLKAQNQMLLDRLTALEAKVSQNQ